MNPGHGSERELTDAMRTLQAIATRGGSAWTSLHAAAACDHAAAARFLLNSGMPVDARDLEGDTPLHIAAQAGHTAVARVLLEAGATRVTIGAFGHTPSQRAALMGHHELAELLGGSPGSWARRLLRRLRRASRAVVHGEA